MSLPNLPNQFQTHIEHNFRSDKQSFDRNYTTEYEEYYDYTNDRGTVIKYIDYKLERRHFLYETNELIAINGNHSLF